MEIEVDESLSTSGIFLSTDTLKGIQVRKTREEVFRIMEKELKLDLRSRYRSSEDIKDDRIVRALRDYYWSIGIDPTKTRPSSEALLRRILRKELPRINNLVDSGNFASARTLVPVGIYDLDRITGNVRLCASRQGDHFKGIGGKENVLEEGIPVLKDDEGVLHIFPHRDSTRTMITERCANALLVACGVRGMKKRSTVKALESVLHYWEQFRE